MISQANCTATTPMGATLLSDQGLPGGGATFRVGRRAPTRSI